LVRLVVRPWDGSAPFEIDQPEETYTLYAGSNPTEDTEWMRYGYTSLVTPASTYEYNMRTGERRLLKQQEVMGGYDASQFVTKRYWATAPDGTQIPISWVGPADAVDRPVPTLLYGYGSYGITIDPTFSIARLSLLDRGMAYAIAHIRGGEYLGREWYEHGRMEHKMNSFTDFIACGEFLKSSGHADQLYAMGGSAGGLLMGAVINLRPDLWSGVIAAVPFVDVVTTMLDESIPLTTGEYNEWGNPNEEEAYFRMKSYSPYDNVAAMDYPPLLITTGLHDSQVQYWEPAKWIARLREMRSNKAPLFMYCNMDTGHGGASGRYEAYKETAMEYAFFLGLLNGSL
jgi:oligopeptidase B